MPEKTKKSAAKKTTAAKKTAAGTKKKTIKKSAAKKSLTKKSIPKKKAALKKRIKKDNKKTALAKMDEKEIQAYDRGDTPMTVVDHLSEFRSRLLVCLASIIVLTIVAFFFSDYVIKFINEPFLKTGQKLNIFKLTGGFIIKIKVSIVAALLISLPLIVIQFWRFIMPAISTQERRFSRISIISTILLFYSGMAFVFFVILPFAIPMLLGFIPGDMLSTIGADDYLTFILISGLAMGLLFELPIAVLILTKIGIITPHFLIQKRKISIVAIWIIAALITPQDPLTQIIVAVPLMFLYEISILISRIVFKNKIKRK